MANVLSDTRSDSSPAPEHDLPHAVTTQAAMILGMPMVLTILLVLQDRRHALRDDS